MCENKCSYSLLVTTATVLSESQTGVYTPKTCETIEVKFNGLYLAEKAFSNIQSEIKKGCKIYLGVIKLY
jgi:hypothetical protein